MAPITAASIRNGIDPFDNDESFGCCGCRCGERCVIFTKHFLLPLLGGLIYAATIAADINVVVGDYLTGNIIYAAVTFGLVFVPSLFFSLYMFVYTIGNNTGCLAGFLSITWILLFPVMPLWPIIRSLIQMVKALVTICGKKEKLYERNNQLSKKSSSHLLKFLQAFTASAPQLVIRLHKLAAINPDKPFASFSVAEIIQISVALFSLSMAVVSTYNKSVDTSGVKRGKLAFHKLSCGASANSEHSTRPTSTVCTKVDISLRKQSPQTVCAEQIGQVLTKQPSNISNIQLSSARSCSTTIPNQPFRRASAFILASLVIMVLASAITATPTRTDYYISYRGELFGFQCFRIVNSLNCACRRATELHEQAIAEGNAQLEEPYAALQDLPRNNRYNSLFGACCGRTRKCNIADLLKICSLVQTNGPCIN